MKTCKTCGKERRRFGNECHKCHKETIEDRKLMRALKGRGVMSQDQADDLNGYLRRKR